MFTLVAIAIYGKKQEALSYGTLFWSMKHLQDVHSSAAVNLEFVAQGAQDFYERAQHNR